MIQLLKITLCHQTRNKKENLPENDTTNNENKSTKSFDENTTLVSDGSTTRSKIDHSKHVVKLSEEKKEEIRQQLFNQKIHKNSSVPKEDNSKICGKFINILLN